MLTCIFNLSLTYCLLSDIDRKHWSLDRTATCRRIFTIINKHLICTMSHRSTDLQTNHLRNFPCSFAFRTKHNRRSSDLYWVITHNTKKTGLCDLKSVILRSEKMARFARIIGCDTQIRKSIGKQSGWLIINHWLKRIENILCMNVLKAKWITCIDN